MSTEGRAAEPSGPAGTAVRGLHLFALSALAVAQPLFDLLSRGAEFFVAHRTSQGELLLIVACLCLGPPLLLLAAQGLAGLTRPSLGRALHLAIVGLLFALLLLPPLGKSPAASLPAAVLAVAALAGGTFALAYRRFAPLRQLLTILAPLALAFPLLFLLASPVGELLVGEDEGTEARAAAGAEVEVESEAGAEVETMPGSRAAAIPVVFLVLDELAVTSLMDESRGIDAERYPSFAALAAEATWYRNATTVAIETVTAVPAILTGRYPDHPGHPSPPPRLPTAEAYPESLFTLLAPSHELRVFESITRLCPQLLCAEEPAGAGRRLLAPLADLSVVYLHLVLPEPWTARLPPVTATWRGFAGDTLFGGDESRDAQFERFLGALGTAEEPALYYLHSMLPHVPWEYLPNGRRYGPMDAPKFPHGLGEDAWETWDEDPWHSVQGFQRYLLQLAFVDRLLGRLTDRLRETGLWERALVVVTADHGLSFRPGDRRRPLTETNAHDILSVPLFVKRPGQRRGRIDERSVDVADILPTVAEVLGLEPPWEMDGRSLLGRGHPYRGEKTVFRGQGEVRLTLPDPAREKYKTLRRMLELFGAGEGPPGLWAVGPRPELVGRAVQGLAEAEPAAGCEIRLAEPRITAPVAAGSALLPVHVVGTLETSESERPLALAIALDGVVRATTRTFDQGRFTRFTAMLPEAVLGRTAPDVGFYLIRERDGGGVALARCGAGKELRFTLHRGRDGREHLRGPDGEEIPVVDGYLTAHLDSMRWEGDRFELAGWAADIGHHELPAAIVVFVDGEPILAAPTNEARESVPGIDEESFLWRGFRFLLGRASLGSAHRPEMRIFAVSRRGVATELDYFEGFPWAPRGE